MISMPIDSSKRKTDMMELWKNIFHDSTGYIKLVFEAYFRSDNAFTVYEGENLIAALLCVPYDFMAFDNAGNRFFLKGMYLCGLATRPEYRKRGIMSALIREAEHRAWERGYDMTFLIPADDNLREYYKKKGYFTASYRKLYKPSVAGCNNHSELNHYSLKDLFQKGKIQFIRELAQWCCERELRSKQPMLLHSVDDMVTVMLENENSFLTADSTFDLKYPILAKVVSVVFPVAKDESNNCRRIVGLFLRDGKENSFNPDRALCIGCTDKTVHRDPCQVEFEFFLPSDEESAGDGRVVPYAMVRPNENSPNYLYLRKSIFNISLLLD